MSTEGIDIEVRIGHDPQISERLRTALEELITAVQDADLADDVAGFGEIGFSSIKIGSGRPSGVASRPQADQFVCLGYYYDETTQKDTCWVNW